MYSRDFDAFGTISVDAEVFVRLPAAEHEALQTQQIQHTSAYVSIRQLNAEVLVGLAAA